MRIRLVSWGAMLAFCLLPAASSATRIFEFEGVSNKGVNVAFKAELTISGDDLTIVLTNQSQSHSGGGAISANPDDLLTSLYFDIFDTVLGRPSLSWAATNPATGDLWKTVNGSADVDQTDVSLRVTNSSAPFDDTFGTWQFKDTFSTGCPGPTCWTAPLSVGGYDLHMGIGTAGNNTLTPNGFNGNRVDGVDYGIYTGNDVEAGGLNQLLLVKDNATFRFTGVNGWGEDDIADGILFGLGTQPDSTGFVPEPGTGLLVMMGMLGLAGAGRRRSPR